MTIAVMFPGQGAQEPGMGAPWHDHPAWGLVARAEQAAGRPLASLLLDAPAAELGHTREAQLAVFLTSLMAWEAARDAIAAPAAFAGHSLGQLTALVAAGALGFEDGVRLVSRRGELTQSAANRTLGCMAALLGASVDDAAAACRAAPDACWVANDNAPGQVVVAGTPQGVEAAGAAAREHGIRRVVPLNVEGAFHTPLMAEAADALRQELAGISFADPTVAVVDNVDAAPHGDAEGWRNRLADHLVSPVRWRECLIALAGLGADTFVEVGPGGVLGGLVRRTLPDATVRTIASPADVAPVSVP